MRPLPSARRRESQEAAQTRRVQEQEVGAYLTKPAAIIFDVETTGLKPGADRLHGLSLQRSDMEAPFEYQLLADMPQEWRDWFADPEISKINQHVKFDVKFLRASGVVVNGPLLCSMLGQHVLNENRPLGLEAITEAHLGPGRLKGYEALLRELLARGLKHVGYLCAEDLDKPGHPHLQLLKSYGSEDVQNAGDAYKVIRAKLSELDSALRKQGAKLTPLDYYLAETMPTEALMAEVELRGIRLLPGFVEELRQKLADRKGQLTGELKLLVGARLALIEADMAERSKSKLKTEKAKASRIPGVHKDCSYSWASSHHLALLLYGDGPGCFGLPATYTEAGTPATDELALEAAARAAKGAEAPTVRQLVDTLIAIRNVSKNLNTYIGNKARGFLKDVRDGRYYPTYDARIVTGRLGSFAHTFPRDFEITRGLVPDDGEVFVYFDYAAIELRIAAHLSQDPEMLRWFREGVDPHRATASRLFGVDESAVTDEQRQVGKRTNFLLIYDGSAWRLEQTLRAEVGVALSVENCQKFRDAFFKAHPVYRKHMDSLLAGLDRRGWILAENGRLRRLPDVSFGRCLDWRLRKARLTPHQAASLGGGTPEELFDKARKAYNHSRKQALNFPVQSLGATITKRACIAAARAGFKLVFTKHDSAVFSVPVTEVGRAVTELRQIAESSWQMSVPLRADFKILRSLHESDRDKDLEALYL